MRPPLRIQSPANPRVKRILKLRKPRERRAANVALAEGVREVTRAMAAGLAVEELWLCPPCWERRGQTLPETIRSLIDADTCDCFETDEKLFVKMTYRDDPEGMLAVVRAPRWTLSNLPTADDALVLIAVGTAKPGNLGAMVRTADAAGCAFVLAAGGAPPPEAVGVGGEASGGGAVDLFNPNAVRASTGAIFSMPTVACGDDEAIAFCKAKGLRIIATTPDAGSLHTETDLTGPAAIVIGPEDTGLSTAWLDAADARVLIPMRGRTADSLNASNAAAVLLFEALRQRG